MKKITRKLIDADVREFLSDDFSQTLVFFLEKKYRGEPEIFIKRYFTKVCFYEHLSFLNEKNNQFKNEDEAKRAFTKYFNKKFVKEGAVNICSDCEEHLRLSNEQDNNYSIC